MTAKSCPRGTRKVGRRCLPKTYGWNIEEMTDLAGKILDDQATTMDTYALADMTLKYFEEKGK